MITSVIKYFWHFTSNCLQPIDRFLKLDSFQTKFDNFCPKFSACTYQSSISSIFCTFCCRNWLLNMKNELKGYYKSGIELQYLFQNKNCFDFYSWLVILMLIKLIIKKLVAIIFWHLCFVPAKQHQALVSKRRGMSPKIVREYCTNGSENDGGDGS